MRYPGSIIHLKKIIRKVVYRLKWLYGQPVDIYRENQGAYNTETGRHVITSDKYHIDRMIVLPAGYHRDIFQSISFLKANSNFAYGGDIELDDRQFIIDARDLPVTFELDEKDYLIYENRKYKIIKLDYLEGQTGYYVNARRPTNQNVTQIHEESIRTMAVVNSEFTTE